MQKVLNKITKENEVNETLMKMCNSYQVMQLWQIVINGNRKVHKGKPLRYNASKDEMFFTAGNMGYDFDLTKEIYCFWREQLLIFKSRITFLSDFKVAVKSPKSIIIHDKRAYTRVDCSRNKFRLNFYFGQKTQNMRMMFPYSSRILNYSSQGLALKVAKININKFFIGDNITMRLPNKNHSITQGKIVHITTVSRNEYIVGVRYVDA